MAERRRRLLRAMVAVAAERGYSGATVSLVASRAGLSRAAFYRAYRDRDECFSLAADALRGRLANLTSEPELRTVLVGVLRALAADPELAAVLFLAAPAAPRPLRAQHDRFLGRLERQLADVVAFPRDTGVRPLPPAALLGAVAQIVSSRLLDGSAASLPDCGEELLAWLDSYSLARSDPNPEALWERLATSFPPLSRRPDDSAIAAFLTSPDRRPGDEAAAARRRRILLAVADVVAVRDYTKATVADVVAAAGVSRGVFYSHFTGLQDAFIATQALALEESIAAAASGYSVACMWPRQVWSGLRAFLAYVARNPALAWLGFVEVPAAGPAALARDRENRQAYALFLEPGFRTSPAPPLFAEAIAGALHGLIRRQILRDRVAFTLELLPQAAFIALSPFLGAAEALSFVEAQATDGAA